MIRKAKEKPIDEEQKQDKGSDMSGSDPGSVRSFREDQISFREFQKMMKAVI